MRRTLLSTLLLLAVSRLTSADPGPGWTALERTNFDYGGKLIAAAPDIAVSPVTGLPYVVYWAQWNPKDGNDTVICFARPERKARVLDWSEARKAPSEVAPRGHKAVVPAIAVGSKGGHEAIHVIWYDHKGTEDIVYARSDDGGKTWSAPFNISESGKAAPGFTQNGTLAADDKGDVFIAWPDWAGNENANGLDIWFRRFNGATGTWEPKVNIEKDPRTKSSFPKVVVAAKGRVHVAWGDRIGKPRLSCAASVDGGATFSPPEKVFEAPEDHDLQGAALGVADDGTIWAAAQTPPAFGKKGPTDLWSAFKKPEGAWSAPEKVAGSNPCANPYIVTGGGMVYLGWLRYTKDQFDITVATREADGWSKPVNVTGDGKWKGYTGGHIVVDAADGFLHAVTDDTPDGRHQVYVTTRDMRAGAK